MAATLTNSGELTYLSFPIAKTETTPDGDIYVYGKATDGSVDSDEQIVDPDFSSKAIGDWLASGANVRVQHNSQRDPAGVGVEANTDADGSTWVKSLVIEPVAKRLVEKGALRAYSVGIARPKIVRDGVARGGRIVDGQIVEISLVDRPANKNCGIQLVKSASDGSPEWVGKVFGAESVFPVDDDDMITVDIPKTASVSFSPADLAKLMQVKKNLEADAVKRQMDPDVGGGVDRDKIPAADFAGRDRSFPIVKPGDVSDAASSIGRAGPDNFSSDQLRENITRIAHRKGPSFVAELPDSWKDDMSGKTDDTVAVEKADTPVEAKPEEVEKGKKPFPGAAPPLDGRDSDGDGADTDKPGSHVDDEENPPKKVKPGSKKADNLAELVAKGVLSVDEARAQLGLAPWGIPDTAAPFNTPEPVVKGQKNCKGCGKGYDADAKVRKCESCGKKLPKADKSIETPAVEKKDKVLCPGCGANVHDDHKFCPECGKGLGSAMPLKKNHDFTCLGCGSELDKGEKFCGNCGKKNPGYLPEADEKVKQQKEEAVEKGKPTPDVAVGAGSADIQPVPVHREPDGPFIESLEADMHIPTDPDAPFVMEMKAAQRIKHSRAPYETGALHDLLCPGFHPATAAKCHPMVSLESLDLTPWSQKAEDAVYSGAFDEAKKSADLLQAASTLKGMGADTYFGLALDAHKAFRDANPGPADFPKPTELTPARFNRPYLAVGRATPGMDYDGPNTHAVPQSSITAAQFNEGYQTAGRAAQSPSNKGDAIVPAPVPTGSPQRTYYTNVQRDTARSAMQSMHDHIAQTFPDLCPMSGHAGPGLEGSAPVGARPVPTPVGKSEDTEASLSKAVAAGKMSLEDARKALGLVKAEKPAEARVEPADAVPVGVGTEPADAAPVMKAMTVDAELIKNAMLEVTGGLLAKLNSLEESLKAERKQNKKLAEAVDALGNLADPTVNAYRAGGLTPPVVKNSSPGGWSVAETAERTQAAFMQVLTDDARNHPDPGVRERAWAKIYEMTGLNGR